MDSYRKLLCKKQLCKALLACHLVIVHYVIQVFITIRLLFLGAVLWIVFAWLHISISAFYAAIQNTAGMLITD